MPKRSRSGDVSNAMRVVAPTSVNRGRFKPDAASGRSLADHDVERIVLHGGVEDFLHHTAEPMDLINKEDIPFAKVG